MNLIVGFSGIGKTTLCETKGGVDISYSNLSPYHVERDLLWTLDHNKDRFKTIRVHREILEVLINNNIDFTLYLPSLDIKDEWFNRLEKRGDNNSFIEKVKKEWNDDMEYYHSFENKVILQKDNYLSDYIE
jgi:hypothetical protein